ncbi:MAG: site-2 protease family protein [Pseudomonadota bacterium]|nr:site-2 protease family protein [Pseudomonadota bacterium]
MLKTYPWIFELFIWLIPTVTAISWREATKVRLCKLRGDATASMVGLGSFMSFKNLDPIGSAIAPILMIFRHKEFIYAWAKSSTIRVGFLKRGRSDVIFIVTLGMLSNLALAFGWVGVAFLGKMLGNNEASSFLLAIADAGIKINLLLTVVHLIPLPPMDISLIIREYLPRYTKGFYKMFDPIGHYVIYLAIFFQTPFTVVFLNPLLNSIEANLLQIVGVSL